MSEMNDEERARRQEALTKLSEIGQAMERGRKLYEHDNDTWWNGLTEKEREDAFYAVCKRIHDGDIIQNGSYRYVLYDVFGFDAGMYGAGMDCGYMAIHNAIAEGEELQRMNSVDHLELINGDETVYALGNGQVKRIRFRLDNDGCTLKILINGKSPLDI